MKDIKSIVEFIDLILIDRRLLVKRLQKDILAKSLPEQDLCRVGLRILENNIEEFESIRNSLNSIINSAPTNNFG